MSTVIECLETRGLIDAITSEDLRTRVQAPIRCYLGFDPTAKSLHLGHWMGMVVMAWFQRYGHTPVILLGGATGKIGDPSGKSLERPVLAESEIIENVTSLRKQFSRVLDFTCSGNRAMILDNADWLGEYNLIDFLRDVGRHFRIGAMLAKESVRTRIATEEGINFTEFSYQILQAFDFYFLYTHKHVELQIGGSDQWGNITAGLDFIRKQKGSAFGMTFPLLTRSDGKKFGKTEGGAVWLDENLLSPYEFYQYLVRIPDRDVIRMMKLLTFLDIEEIEEYGRGMEAPSYVSNTAQKRLAEELTRLVHGQEGVERALRATESIAPGNRTELTALAFATADVPRIEIKRSALLGMKCTELLVYTGLSLTKGEAHRLILQGGAYLNNNKVADPDCRIDATSIIDSKYLLLSAGKKRKVLVQILLDDK